MDSEKTEFNKLIWIVWDAASMDTVERLLQEDKLPNLKSLLQNGTSCRVKLKQLNCQTPAALATMFTGLTPYRHGIGGYYTPQIEEGKSLLSKKVSFNEESIHDYSIWRWAVENGRTVSLVHTPYVKNIEIEQLEQYKFQIYGYHRMISRGRVFLSTAMAWEKSIFYSNMDDKGYSSECSVIEIEGLQFQIDMIERETEIIAAVAYAECNTCIEIKVGCATSFESHDIKLDSETAVQIYAFFKPGGSGEIVFVFSGIYQMTSITGIDIERFIDETGVFLGEGFGRYYRKGFFGKTLERGGTGEAEAAFINLLDKIASYYERVSRYSIINHMADISIIYQPCIDEMAHEFTGFVDPLCRLYSSEYSSQYRDCYIKAYEMADRHLGEVLDCMPEGCTVVVTSDHGMGTVSDMFNINEYLKLNGLLDFDQQGGIDLTKTMAFYHPADNGAIFINTENYLGGIVSLDEKQLIIEKVVKLLENCRNEATGEAVIRKINRICDYDMENKNIYGDIFVEPSYGYSIKPGQAKKVIEDTNKSGSHHSNAEFDCMDAIFFAGGAGVKDKIDGQNISNTEIFPIICKLTDLPLPKHINSL